MKSHVILCLGLAFCFFTHAEAWCRYESNSGLQYFVVLIIMNGIYTEHLYRVFEKEMFCADGDAHDTLLPDDVHYSCKKGPGNLVKCKNFWFTLKESFQCPGYGYLSGWHLVGEKVVTRCCSEPGIYYSHKNCTIHFNNDVANRRCYRVYKEKVITGFKTLDGGFTYFNNECWYNSSPKYTFHQLIRKKY